jgi:hypothetical protein
MALVICVLVGGLSPATWDLALIKIPSGYAPNEPEVHVGLSGICVALGGGPVKCWSKFPYKFNQQVVGGSLVSIQPEEFRNPAYKNTHDHPNPVPTLAKLLASMLILSLFLGPISLVVSQTRDTGFSKAVLLVAGPDLVILAGCGTMVYFIAAGYPKASWAAPQMHVGAVLLYTAIGTRVLSHVVFVKTAAKVSKVLLKILCRPNRRTTYGNNDY